MKRLMTIFVMIVALTMLFSAADGAGLSGLETLLPLAPKPKVKNSGYHYLVGSFRI